MGWYILVFFIGALLGAGGVAFLVVKYKKELDALQAKYDAVTGQIPH